MKLSEAMRKGCEGTKPMKEALFNEDYTKACALGAAYFGRFGSARDYDGDPVDRLADEFPELRTKRVHNPANFREEWGLYIVILALNDDYEWEREAIAAWLEGMGL